MKVFRSVAEFRAWRIVAGEGRQKSVGFVPTMGALHAGHRSLLDTARTENEIVVLSIFVNPTQFNQASDLEMYPRTESADLALAKAAGVDAVFLPQNPAELYPEGYRYRVTESEFAGELCGAFRPGHFDGVLTVVLKLLMLTAADRAYFGEKDHQQLTLIAGMAKDFFLPVEIIGCPTLRESDGLAMSSRNVRLKPGERERAPLVYRALRMSGIADARALLETSGFRVEYLVERGGRRYVAAWLGEVRLIDNVACTA